MTLYSDLWIRYTHIHGCEACISKYTHTLFIMVFINVYTFKKSLNYVPIMFPWRRLLLPSGPDILLLLLWLLQEPRKKKNGGSRICFEYLLLYMLWLATNAHLLVYCNAISSQERERDEFHYWLTDVYIYLSCIYFFFSSFMNSGRVFWRGITGRSPRSCAVELRGETGRGRPDWVPPVGRDGSSRRGWVDVHLCPSRPGLHITRWITVVDRYGGSSVPYSPFFLSLFFFYWNRSLAFS